MTSETKHGRIYYVMGKSASGKDTVFSQILKKKPDFLRLMTYTTRPRRDGEEQDREYHFTNSQEIESFEKKGLLIEKRIYHTQCGDWIYATVDDGSIISDADYLGIGTLASYIKLKQYFGEKRLVPIYLTLDDGRRLGRALKREDKQKEPNYLEMCRRFLADEEDFSADRLKRAGIKKAYLNDNLDDCIARIIKDMV